MWVPQWGSTFSGQLDIVPEGIVDLDLGMDLQDPQINVTYLYSAASCDVAELGELSESRS